MIFDDPRKVDEAEDRQLMRQGIRNLWGRGDRFPPILGGTGS